MNIAKGAKATFIERLRSLDANDEPADWDDEIRRGAGKRAPVGGTVLVKLMLTIANELDEANVDWPDERYLKTVEDIAGSAVVAIRQGDVSDWRTATEFVVRRTRQAISEPPSDGASGGAPVVE